MPELVIAVVGLVVTVAVAITSARRAEYDRVLDIIGYFSSEQVSQSRHAIGSLAESGNLGAYLDGKSANEINGLVSDLFNVYWAFGRINAVNNSLRPFWGRGPRRLLRETLQPWVEYWGGGDRNEQVKRELNKALTGGPLRSPLSVSSDKALLALVEAWK